VGYSGATTELIAEEAGVSRGAFQHQFGTRAELMARVIRHVYRKELEEYAKLENELHIGGRLADWAELLFRVLSRPSGVAVLEILEASRRDPDLADLVGPTEGRLEQNATRMPLPELGPDESANLAVVRMVVWTIRGLIIAQGVATEPDEIEKSVILFRRVLEAATEAGVFEKWAASATESASRQSQR
jgi:AcrR family transcriptional regulator